MPAQESQLKELVRRYVREVTMDGQLERIEDYLAEEWTSHSAGLPDMHSAEELRAFLTMLHTAFPNLDVTFEDVIAEEDKVVVRSHYTGTHEGEFMGLDATGESAEMGAIVIYQVEDGRIAEEWHVAGLLGLMQQLGAVPAPG